MLACDATSSFPEQLWSLPLQQARFPDFRLERVASRPSQSQRTSDHHLEATQSPVHSGGNRLGFSPIFPCHPLWAPATVQFAIDRQRIETAIITMQRTYPVTWACKLYVERRAGVKLHPQITQIP